jgi:hypothetical protein
MADVEERNLTKITNLDSNDYIRAITADGQSVLIKKSDLTLDGTIKVGFVNRAKTFLYDCYSTRAIIYRALTFTTDLIPGQFMIALLDIKDILSWNYSGNLKITVKITVINYLIVRINIINNTTQGLIKSIYAYFNAENKLCFTINFNGLNISNGIILANCSYHKVGQSPDFSNKITNQDETEMYIADTYSNQIGVIL